MVALSIPRRIVDISVGAPSGAARRFTNANPASPGLYCSFECKSWAKPQPNEATVKIHNCADSTIRYLESPGFSVTVNAGSGIPGQLFQGAISRDGVATKVEGNDRVTTLAAADGRRAYRDAVFSKSYPSATLLLDVIIRDIAIAMGKPLTVAATIPPPLRTYAIPGPWAVHGEASAALDEALLPWGLTWSIINGVLFVLDPLRPLPGNAPLITPKSGLHGSPTRTKKGAKFKADLSAAIVAAKASVLQAERLSGTYLNTEVVHKGNTEGTDWFTKVQGDKL